MAHGGGGADEQLDKEFWQHVELQATEHWRSNIQYEAEANDMASQPEIGSRPSGRSFKRDGWAIRPWKGPLPRPKPRTARPVTHASSLWTASAPHRRLRASSCRRRNPLAG
ncbi:hypothetical protein BS78_01G063500 [Paspalum vaginatum]|nr:hypothetical protein BS78_01G063500 [Paspalum vaginatum]